MLKQRLIHPELLSVLAKMGHTSRILLADANYAFDINAPESAKRIFLNFAPGLLSVTDILDVLLDTIPVETAHVMLTDDGDEPPIFEEFRQLLPPEVRPEPLDRLAFYEFVKSPQTSVVVATGEQRLFANILLTVGYIKPDGTPNF